MIRALFICALLLAAGPAAAQQVVADLSESEIRLEYRFTGRDILLFGAIDHDAGYDPAALDLVVLVRGPRVPVTVRRKERVFGIWVNTDAHLFETTPGYYAYAASRPLAGIAPPETLNSLGIGFDSLDIRDAAHGDADVADFRSGLVRNKARDGLYTDLSGNLSVKQERLFRAEFAFPAKVPVGPYRAEIYLFHDGRLVGRTSTPLDVEKVGFSRFIYRFAQDRPALYGLFAVVLALLAGWLAGEVSRQRS